MTFTDPELRCLGVALEFYLEMAPSERPSAATALAKVLDEFDRRGIEITRVDAWEGP